MSEFAETSICSECDFQKYFHSGTFYDFTNDNTALPPAWFKFTLPASVDYKKDVFTISVSQQGDRLGRYRLSDESKKFEASMFNIVLGKADGTFVKADVGDDFLFYLENENVSLTPGEYIVMIDPIWNSKAKQDKLYKDIHIDIYSTHQVELEPIDD